MIIGLCGLAGSGKSTVAKALVRQYGYVRRPFAYPLKRMAGAILPAHLVAVLDGNNVEKEKPRHELGGKSVRELLQTLGTEWGRAHMGQNFWVDQWMRGLSSFPRVVADDVRFANEAAAIKALGGILVRVQREGAGSTVGAGHASETSMGGISVDCVLINDGDVSELEASVAELVEVGHGSKKANSQEAASPAAPG